MGSLENRKPGDTFQQFLRVESQPGIGLNQLLGAQEAFTVEDGLGNQIPMQVSTDYVKINALYLQNDGPFSSRADLNIAEKLNQLDDISISDLQNGDTIAFDPYENNWKNTNIVDGGSF